MKLSKYLMVCLAVLYFTGAQAEPEVSNNTQTIATSQTLEDQLIMLDKVVAVVNDDVITQRELDDKLKETIAQLQKQGTPLPPQNVLEKQMLERMITDMLQLQFAKESGVRVDDNELDQSIKRIAEQNKFTDLAAFRVRLEKDGIDYPKYREEIRDEIIFNRLKEREIESKLIISDSEVDAYLANKAKMGNSNEEYHLAHILIVVPEQASADKIQASQARAEKAYNQLKAGADFAQIAASFSDAKNAMTGGDLGWRDSDQLPPAFMDVLQKMEPDQITPVMRSTSGFHILKLIAKRTGNAPVVIEQTHARHILIKTNEITSDEEAKKRILEVQSRIQAGADFAEQARRYSEDGSAQQGGDLGWLSPGQTVPEFQQEMDKLNINQMGIVQSQFGWHLIQVLSRRQTDITEQQKRQQARIAMGTFKSDELYQDWLRQLRDRAFVENYLDSKS